MEASAAPSDGASPHTDGGYVSLELAAGAAGITLAEMQRIAADFAKGRAHEPWHGATLSVRTEKVLGRRQRDILVSSLPEWVRAALATNRFRFRLAAEQAMPETELRPSDFMLLHRAAQDGFAEADFINATVARICAGAPLLHVSRERFELLLDNFYGWGFRDPALPGVSPDYRDFLDRSRRHLGMSGRYYQCVLAELAEVERPEHLDGAGFVRVADFLMRQGLPWTLPDRGCMDRETIGALHAAVHQLNISYGEHADTVLRIGGGAVRTRDLDASGWLRVRAAYLKAGHRPPPPAPRACGEAGLITQAQANLIWRLYADRTAQPTASDLDRHCGGSLAGLTQAGARSIIDELLGPLIALRLEAVAMLADLERRSETAR